jgi:hypothetical protein
MMENLLGREEGPAINVLSLLLFKYFYFLEAAIFSCAMNIHLKLLSKWKSLSTKPSLFAPF